MRRCGVVCVGGLKTAIEAAIERLDQLATRRAKF
jgi:hypothetical protein